jgi:hypothetical protein
MWPVVMMPGAAHKAEDGGMECMAKQFTNEEAACLVQAEVLHHQPKRALMRTVVHASVDLPVSCPLTFMLVAAAVAVLVLMLMPPQGVPSAAGPCTAC